MIIALSVLELHKTSGEELSGLVCSTRLIIDKVERFKLTYFGRYRTLGKS